MLPGAYIVEGSDGLAPVKQVSQLGLHFLLHSQFLSLA